MLINLIKKDILLTKKYVFIVMALTIILPLFIMFKIPELLGFISFLITVIYAELILIQSVQLAETKYPKATTLLCSTPYPKSLIVLGKYVFSFILFIFCYAVYSILAIIFPSIESLSLISISLVFLILSIVIGIYLPFQYKFGYEKARYFGMLIIFFCPFVLPNIMSKITEYHFNFNLSQSMLILITLCLALIINVLSILISIRIFSNKEF